MGCYINPQNETKEEFLRTNGLPPDSFEQFKDWNERPKGMLPVVLVDNGWMTAAAIAYKPTELKAFTYPDPRPKQYYYVSIDKLKEVTDLERYFALMVQDGLEVPT